MALEETQICAWSLPKVFTPFLPNPSACLAPWVGYSCCLFLTEKAEDRDGQGEAV